MLRPGAAGVRRSCLLFAGFGCFALGIYFAFFLGRARAGSFLPLVALSHSATTFLPPTFLTLVWKNPACFRDLYGIS